MKLPQEMNVATLTPKEELAWKSSLDAYDGVAQLSLQFDQWLIDLGNGLARAGEENTLPPNQKEPAIIAALNEAAPIYRAYLWPKHQHQDRGWITENCADIRRHDRDVKRAIAAYFHVRAPKEPILVDLARETGRSLAYTTAGPEGTSGHTVLAPQKNADRMTALNTIFHEMSHTMVDESLINAIKVEAVRQHVDPPEDLWHAMTLYTTTEITKQVLHADSMERGVLDSDRAKMFERNGWHTTLLALERDWQPYLEKKVDFKRAMADLVRDTVK